jgi:hypothetical protein
MVTDLVHLLGQAIAFAAVHARGQLALYAIAGLIAAVLCFFLCSWFARLWNRQIEFTVGHRVWCMVAAMMTVFVAIALAGVMRLSDVARLRVAEWSDALGTPEIHGKIWEAQHRALVSAGYPQPDYDRAPEQGGSLLRTSDQQSQEIFAHAMADVAMSLFDQQNHLLHRLIASRDEQAVRSVVADQTQFFSTHKNSSDAADRAYPLQRAVAVLQHEMEAEFSARIPIFQWRALLVAIVLALLTQVAPFVLAGIAAYRQIRIHPDAGRYGRRARPAGMATTSAGKTRRYHR